MSPRCDYCDQAAEFRRDPTTALPTVGFRCNVHTPDWRLLEFHPLTTTAVARQNAAIARAIPEPVKETP